LASLDREAPRPESVVRRSKDKETLIWARESTEDGTSKPWGIPYYRTMYQVQRFDDLWHRLLTADDNEPIEVGTLVTNYITLHSEVLLGLDRSKPEGESSTETRPEDPTPTELVNSEYQDIVVERLAELDEAPGERATWRRRVARDWLDTVRYLLATYGLGDTEPWSSLAPDSGATADGSAQASEHSS
ncbi:MAG: hypothetical protein AAGK32_17965, partial [Actinomycetota bacterium]